MEYAQLVRRNWKNVSASDRKPTCRCNASNDTVDSSLQTQESSLSQEQSHLLVHHDASALDGVVHAGALEHTMKYMIRVKGMVAMHVYGSSMMQNDREYTHDGYVRDACSLLPRNVNDEHQRAVDTLKRSGHTPQALAWRPHR